MVELATNTPAFFHCKEHRMNQHSNQQKDKQNDASTSKQQSQQDKDRSKDTHNQGQSDQRDQQRSGETGRGQQGGRGSDNR